MSDRLSVHVAALRVSCISQKEDADRQEIDWEASVEKAGPHPYAEMLVKETATLHKVLSKYLAPSTVEIVLAEVLGAIVSRLGEEYGKVELKSDDAKKR
jgi:vacuolar protein sorting-associated protein 54